jgi:nicotinate-nucleotide adenylyltransferase
VSLRLGVFGGTFDPPHVGHLVTAVNIRHALNLDRVLLMVANVPWQKVASRSVSPAEERFDLVRAATGGVAGLFPSRLELDRGGNSYTADTLAELRAQHEDVELFVILGADAAASLPTWERYQEVRDGATVVVVDRPGSAPTEPLAGWRWVHIEVPHIEVSSTDLRARVVDGRPLDYLVTAPVLRAIGRLGMYQDAST